VGKSPFHWDSGLYADQTAELKLLDTPPPIPEKLLTSEDSDMQTLLLAMVACFRLDPLDRPSAAQVVAILQNQSNKMMAT
jgi:hypothetical protein